MKKYNVDTFALEILKHWRYCPHRWPGLTWILYYCENGLVTMFTLSFSI